MNYKTEKLSINKKVIIIVVSFALLFTSVSSALTDVSDNGSDNNIVAAEAVDEGGSKNNYGGTLYRFMNNIEPALMVMSGAISGGKICGKYCVLGGAAAVLLDKLLIGMGYTANNYLSLGVTVISTVSLMKLPPKAIGGLAAVGAAGWFSAGDGKDKLGEYVSFPMLASGLSGLQIANSLGSFENSIEKSPASFLKFGSLLIVVLLPAVLDNIAIEKNIVDKYYFTSMMTAGAALSSSEIKPKFFIELNASR